MKQCVNSRGFDILVTIILTLIAIDPAYAAGLSQASTVLNTIQENLTVIVPIAATLALMLCGLLYAMRMMHKDSFIHWFIGILIVGSASEITAMIIS